MAAQAQETVDREPVIEEIDLRAIFGFKPDDIKKYTKLGFKAWWVYSPCGTRRVAFWNKKHVDTDSIEYIISSKLDHVGGGYHHAKTFLDAIAQAWVVLETLP